MTNEDGNRSLSDSTFGKTPEDLLEDEVVEDHKRLREHLGHSLRILNSNLLFLKQIHDFDWNFYSGLSELFWLIRENLYRYSAIVIYRLWDDDSETASLDQLRTITFNNFLKSSYNEVTSEKIRELNSQYDYNVKIQPLIEMFRDLRHTRIAHFDKSEIMGDDDTFHSEYGDVDREDFEQVRDYSFDFFDIFTFGVKQDRDFHGLDQDSEGPFGGGDLGELLQRIALGSMHSWLFNADPDDWRNRWKEDLPEEKIEELNKVREEYGLDEIE